MSDSNANRSGDYTARSYRNLLDVLTRLDPILNPHGFHFDIECRGVSSGGAFTNGFYRRGPITIGLIMRGDVLGSPQYSHLERSAGHDDLVDALGRRVEGALRFDHRLDRWCLYTVDGRPVVDALVSDLTTIIVPTITRDLGLYIRGVRLAYTRSMAGIGLDVE